MKFLANENFPRTSVEYLKNAEFDIVSVGNDYAGITDEDVMNLAISKGRTIITFDRDYGTLIYKYGYKPSGGVIYLRLQEFKPIYPGQLIEQIINDSELSFEHRLTVIDNKGTAKKNIDEY